MNKGGAHSNNSEKNGAADGPLVSVVIPVYNVEKYLRECVDSVINQTYRHIETMLIDDGSTDSGGDICEEYALIDSRIKLIHQENQGLGHVAMSVWEKQPGSMLFFWTVMIIGN